MILADTHIRELIRDKVIGLEPFDDSLVQPSSVDIRLGHTLLTMDSNKYTTVDPQDMPLDMFYRRYVPAWLYPGDFVLASSLERLCLPDDMVCILNGKSSLGRIGLIVHATAGYIDPGFFGNITLELSNVGDLPIRLMPGMLIAQLVFQQMMGSAARPYGTDGLGSHYQGQRGPTPPESI